MSTENVIRTLTKPQRLAPDTIAEAPPTIRAQCQDALLCQFHATGGPLFCQCGPDTYAQDTRSKTPDFDFTADPLPEGYTSPPRSSQGPFPDERGDMTSQRFKNLYFCESLPDGAWSEPNHADD